MRKIFKFVLLMLVIVSVVACSASKKKVGSGKKGSLRYNDIRVTFVTTQGEASFYLYPEAAPVTVANFINLAKRGFYNNNKIHRAIENFVVQAGDPTETGTGGPGYQIPDEIVEWLDFFQQGMLAMANAGPGTGGSQYFFTVYPAEWLNGRHTVFGEYIGDNDFEVIKKLEVGDIIKEVKFEGNVDQYLSLHKDQIDQWNAILDEKFPNLKQYPVKPATPSAQAAYKAELDNIYSKKTKKENTHEFFIPKALRKIEKTLGGNKEKAVDTPATTNAAEDATLLQLQSDLDKTQSEIDAMKNAE